MTTLFVGINQFNTGGAYDDAAKHCARELQVNSEKSARMPVAASFSCHVFQGFDLRVTSGANLGDGMDQFEDLCPGDTYRLSDEAATWSLALGSHGAGQAVAQGSELGHSGAPLDPVARLTFMASDGDSVELLLIRIAAAGDAPALVCVLPLAPIAPRIDYTLIGISEEVGKVRWTELASIAFLRGTMISLAGGQQVPIETLRIGDRILTRDNGAQELRWIGHQTVRAIGAFAPVFIPKGAMSNSGDLIVSQHQRLFVYQRGTDRLTETAEMLVKAKYLVDGETVLVREGGYADYYSLVFDAHEVVYAECIPCESLQVNAQTLAQLPDDLAQSVENELPHLNHQRHFGTEASADVLRMSRNKLLKT